MASPERPPVELPERYTDLRHLADGGMASVWAAQDRLLDRRVAVKVLSPAFAADPAGRRRFTREARNAARLSSHPGIVTVYDAGEEDGQAYMVMALYPGGSVGERLKRGPVPRTLALAWLDDAAAALDHAHAEGIVHRDVKPANLLLDDGDRVAVADFGIATAVWDTATMTQTGIVLGTLAYLAPEQRTGAAATPASDRYAFGLVARELLTGARPGAAPVTPVPAAAEAVLARATAEDPARRPPSCAALVDELEAALGGDAPTAVTAPVAAARPRPRAVALPPVEEDTAAHAPATARAARAPVPAAARPPAGPEPTRSRTPLLALLGVLALLVAGGAVVLAGSGGSDPGPVASTKKKTTTTSKAKTTSTAKSTSTQTPPPDTATSEPPPTTSSGTTPATPAAKSRAALIAQNNQSYAKLDSDPGGQIAPLQEAVDGLCDSSQDINCAFALYNLAVAYTRSGRPGDAVPLLQRRLQISSNQRGVVQQALDAALKDAGLAAGAPAAGPGKGNGKEKGKAKGPKGEG